MIAGSSLITGNQRLDGRLDADTLTGGSGNDTIIGFGGNDTLNGGGGVDIVVARRNTNFILTNNSLNYGGSEVATLSGIEQARLFGGDGDNTIDASAFTLGSVFLDGLRGNDILKGGSGNDTLTGGFGLDDLDGGGGTNTAVEVGSRGIVSGAIANATLDLAEGRNEIVTVQLTGTVNGGTFRLNYQGQSTEPISFNANSEDVLRSLLSLKGFDQGDLQVRQPVENGPWFIEFRGKLGGRDQAAITATNINLTGGGTVNANTTVAGTTILNVLKNIQIAQIYGTIGSDLLDGSAFAGSVVFNAGPGHDTLIGSANNDTLNGDEGNDRITGGAGVDSISGGTGRDTLIETRDANITLSNVSLQIGSEIDPLTGIELAILTGGDSANTIDVSAFSGDLAADVQTTIDGRGGADIITGSAGNDRITGGLGADTIRGGAGRDTLVETRDANMTLTPTSLAVGAENDVISDFEAAELSGGASVNTLDARTFSGAVTLATGGGLDILRGANAGDTEYRLSITGLATPANANDTSKQVRVEVGTGQSTSTIVVIQPSNDLRQSDLFWANVIGSTANVDYEITKSNGSLDVGHSSDETYDVKEDLTFSGRNITIEAGTITVVGRKIDTSSNSTNGGDISLKAKHITIDGGATLDTRTLINGTGTTSGKITIEASEDRPQITALGFANVDLLDTDITIGAATIRGGEVTINGTADSTSFVQDSDFGESAAGSVFGAEVSSGILRAIESTAIIASVGYSRSTTKIRLGTSAVTPTIINATNLSIAASSAVSVFATPFAFNLSVAIGIAYTEAIIDIANANITTTSDVSVHASVDHTMNVEGKASNEEFSDLPALALGVSIINSSAIATIGPQAVLTVGNDLFVQANTVDLNSNSAEAEADVQGNLAIAVAISVESGETLASIDGKATVTRNVNVTAKHENSESNLGSSAGVGAADDSGIKDAVLDFLGDANNEGQNAEKATGPFVLAGINLIPLKKIFGAARDKFGDAPTFGPENKPNDIQRKSTQGAISIGVLEDSNQVKARIGDGVLGNPANVANVDAGGFINVIANLQNRPDISITSSTEYDPEVTSIDGGRVNIALTGDVNTGASLAINVSSIDDDAQAIIAGNATVNAKGALTVDAQAINEFDPASTFGTNLAEPFSEEARRGTHQSDSGSKTLNSGDSVFVLKGHTAGGEDETLYKYVGLDGAQVNLATEDYSNTDRWEAVVRGTALAFSFLSTLTDYLDDNLGIDNQLVQYWTQANAKGQKKNSLAASVAVANIKHDAQSRIASGAKVNQNAAGSFRTGTQEVSVTAKSQNDTVNLGGQFQTLGLDDVTSKEWYQKLGENFKNFGGGGNGGGETGRAVGATALVFLYKNDVGAHIEDGAAVFTKALEVIAENQGLDVTVGLQGPIRKIWIYGHRNLSSAR